MNKLLEKKIVRQILKFTVVGGLAFLIDYGLLYILTEFIGIHYLISSIISFTVSVIFNYILSIKWVFDVNKKQGLKEFILFIILSVIGLIINEIIMYLMVDIMNIHYMISKLFSTGVVMVYNFITRKIFIER